MARCTELFIFLVETFIYKQSVLVVEHNAIVRGSEKFLPVGRTGHLFCLLIAKLFKRAVWDDLSLKNLRRVRQVEINAITQIACIEYGYNKSNEKQRYENEMHSITIRQNFAFVKAEILCENMRYENYANQDSPNYGQRQ